MFQPQFTAFEFDLQLPHIALRSLIDIISSEKVLPFLGRHCYAMTLPRAGCSWGFISQQEYLLSHPSWPSSPRAEQSACWALVLDQWPAYWSVTSRSSDKTLNGIWSQDLHTLGSYDWQLKICPEDRMAKNGDSKWPRIECRKLRQGWQVNLPQDQFPGKFPCDPGVTIMWPRRQLENGPLTYGGRNV